MGDTHLAGMQGALKELYADAFDNMWLWSPSIFDPKSRQSSHAGHHTSLYSTITSKYDWCEECKRVFYNK